MGAQIFLECSAKENTNIEKLFTEMSKLLMEKNATVSKLDYVDVYFDCRQQDRNQSAWVTRRIERRKQKSAADRRKYF